jgi:hypothetical protein
MRVAVLTLSAIVGALAAGAFLALASPSGEDVPQTRVVLGPPAVAPGEAEGEVSAKEACEARLARYEDGSFATGLELAASFPTTARDVAAEEERRQGGGFRSEFRDRPAEEFLALCFFDSDGFGIPKGSRRVPSGAYTRLEEVVRSDGAPYVLRAGHTESIPVRPIGSREESRP